MSPQCRAIFCGVLLTACVPNPSAPGAAQLVARQTTPGSDGRIIRVFQVVADATEGPKLGRRSDFTLNAFCGDETDHLMLQITRSASWGTAYYDVGTVRARANATPPTEQQSHRWTQETLAAFLANVEQCERLHLLVGSAQVAIEVGSDGEVRSAELTGSPQR